MHACMQHAMLSDSACMRQLQVTLAWGHCFAGHLLLCDGSCMRAFHGGMTSLLGAGDDDMALPQNAAAGGGDRQRVTHRAELCRCIKSSCGRYYHPSCLQRTVAELDAGFLWCACSLSWAYRTVLTVQASSCRPGSQQAWPQT